MRQEVGALLAALKPDGVILTPPSCDNEVVLELLDKAGTPMCGWARKSPRAWVRACTWDDVAAAHEMTDHLADLGHQRIGFIMGDPRYGAAPARREGYVAAMKTRGLDVDEAWIRDGDFTFESGHRAATALLALPERPTAIFASNDDMALGALAAAAEADLSVPGDLSVAGFDDSPVSRLSRPQLTTIRQPLVEMSTLATKMLISGVARNSAAEQGPRDELLPFTLIHRASTAPPRARRGRGDGALAQGQAGVGAGVTGDTRPTFQFQAWSPPARRRHMTRSFSVNMPGIRFVSATGLSRKAM